MHPMQCWYADKPVKANKNLHDELGLEKVNELWLAGTNKLACKERVIACLNIVVN